MKIAVGIPTVSRRGMRANLLEDVLRYVIGVGIVLTDSSLEDAMRQVIAVYQRRLRDDARW